MFENKEEEHRELISVFKEMKKDPSFKTIDITKLGIDLSQFKEPPANKEKSFYSALDILNQDFNSIPRLLNPYFQTTGLASLVGTSDCGKSTFLRQLSIQLSLVNNSFLGLKLEGKTNKVIYVSTEDDMPSIGFALKKQLNFLSSKNPNLDRSLLKNLSFSFETDDLLNRLGKMIKSDPVDLIVIDSFADIFTGEINANTQVRKFLNSYDQFAKRNSCLILFLHHIGKRTQNNLPSKDNIIGSQGFEAKMRTVLELRPSKKDTERELWVLKSNLLDSKHKQAGVILSFNESLIFENTGRKTVSKSVSKKQNPEIIAKVKELSDQGLSIRKIEAKLIGTNLAVSKSVIGEILNSTKENDA